MTKMGKMSCVEQRYCGKCGHDRGEAEFKYPAKCPDCGHVVYSPHSGAPAVGLAIVMAEHLGQEMCALLKAPSGKYLIPGGYVDMAEEGEVLEKPSECASRELFEETGLKFKDLYYLYSYRSSNGHVLIFFTGHIRPSMPLPNLLVDNEVGRVQGKPEWVRTYNLMREDFEYVSHYYAFLRAISWLQQ